MPRTYLLRIISIIVLAALAIWLLFFTASTSSADSSSFEFKSLVNLIPTTTTTIQESTTTTLAIRTKPKHQSHPKPTSPPQVQNPTPVDRSALRACIIQHESGGSYTIKNPGSTASGLGQWLGDEKHPGTWNHYGGYWRAMDAPPGVQEARMDYDMSLSMKHIQGEWAAQRGHCHF